MKAVLPPWCWGLSRDELERIIQEYDRYIQTANDENKYREGWFPVSIEEFYTDEMQEVEE